MHIHRHIFCKLFAVIGTLIILGVPTILHAQDENAWTVTNFRSDIIVNTDASLTIKETINARCPQCIDKHGIFRVLPLSYVNDKRQRIYSPVELQSITDETGTPYPFTTKKSGNTLTWKVGDPATTVTGDHTYAIIYRVINAVRGANPDFDELYWNLNGNFWDIPIEHYTASLTFPDAVTQKNTQLYFYSGKLGSRSNTLSRSSWTDAHTLGVESTAVLEPKNGITVSVAFPKGVIAPYMPGYWEQYGQNAFMLIPLFTFIGMFMLWSRFGKDPKIHAGVVPEFGSPDNLTPMQISMIMTNGSLQHQAITAELINLAVKGIIKITQIPKKGIFGKEDYELEKLRDDPKLTLSQKDLIDRIFILKVHNKIKLSSLQNSFYNDISKIEETIISELAPTHYVPKQKMQGVCIAGIFIALFMGLIFSFIVQWAIGIINSVMSSGSMIIFGSLVATVVIILFFLFLMPRRTKENVAMLFKIRGFKYYMETAEKYRQKFNEKENIFERFLPYAILFGLTGIWAQKMRDIYGEKYIAAYHPLWYSGGSFTYFDVTSFTSSMNSIASAVGSASSSPSSSGGGGGGSSGGGGGGGGGGGW